MASSPPAEPPLPQHPQGDVRVHVMPRGEGLLELGFEGPLRLGWLPRLAGAVSRRRFSIVRVVAERDERGLWRAHLELETGLGTSDAASLDWTALCEEAPSSPSDASAPRLSSFRLQRADGERLELAVTGQDEVGFLSSLFARLGFLGLFAERISAITRHGRIDDVLILAGIGGEAPTPATEQALRTALTRLCVQSGGPKSPVASPPGSKS